jgi:hypothetical protein
VELSIQYDDIVGVDSADLVDVVFCGQGRIGFSSGIEKT